jgi:hypothetical protein
LVLYSNHRRGRLDKLKILFGGDTMKAIMRTLSQALGLLLAGGVILFTSAMTFQAAQRLIPDDWLMQAATVILFDAAAFAWYMQFLYSARGRLQRATALIGFLVGLLGALCMTAAELLLGQGLVIVDTAGVGWLVISVTIGAAVAHAILSYLYHATEPTVFEAIETEETVEGAVAKAHEAARANLERQSAALAAAMAEDIQAQLLARIAARAGQRAIDATARDVLPEPKPHARDLPMANKAERPGEPAPVLRPPEEVLKDAPLAGNGNGKRG